MANYAYRDQERTIVLYSSDAVKEDRNKAFYCPNPKCNAKLYICAIDGSKSAYFRATKHNSKHIEKCPFGNSNSEFNKDKFDETKFVFNNAIDKLLCATEIRKKKKNVREHNTRGYNIGESELHPPRTIRQLYSLCKSMPVRSRYGDKEIGEMLLDDRSGYRYPKGCFGNKIIEAVAKLRIYDDSKKEIYLTAPMDSKKYTFILSFDDRAIYRDIRSEIFNNKDKIIVVCGKWESSGIYNFFVTKMYSKKQIAVIK